MSINYSHNCLFTWVSGWFVSVFITDNWVWVCVNSTHNSMWKCVSSTDDITIFSPSTFYIVIHTTYGFHLDIQLTPIMQVYIKASVSKKGKLKGMLSFCSFFLLNGKISTIPVHVSLCFSTFFLSSLCRPMWRF